MVLWAVSSNQGVFMEIGVSWQNTNPAKRYQADTLQ